MKHITSKLLSLLLTLAMLLSMVPAAYAADDEYVDTYSNESGTLTNYVTVNNGETRYSTLDEAIAAAEPVNGVITYTITGKLEVTKEDWVQVAKVGLTDLTKVEFVGATNDAEICITGGLAILADKTYDIDVSFTKLKLSKPNPAYGSDYGHSTNYFTCWLRNIDAAENTVTYTNCTFPNGVCNNQYGKTVFDSCQFTNSTPGLYNLWNYGGNTEITNSTFTGTRGIKTYNEGTLEVAPTVKIENTTFIDLTEKAAVVASKATDITFENVTTTGCTKGTFQKDIEGSGEKTTVTANGSSINGMFNVTAEKGTEAAKNELNITAGTFTDAVSEDYLAERFTITENSDGTYGVQESTSTAVAKTADGKTPSKPPSMRFLAQIRWFGWTKAYGLRAPRCTTTLRSMRARAKSSLLRAHWNTPSSRRMRRTVMILQKSTSAPTMTRTVLPKISSSRHTSRF